MWVVSTGSRPSSKIWSRGRDPIRLTLSRAGGACEADSVRISAPETTDLNASPMPRRMVTVNVCEPPAGIVNVAGSTCAVTPGPLLAKVAVQVDALASVLVTVRVNVHEGVQFMLR